MNVKNIGTPLPNVVADADIRLLSQGREELTLEQLGTNLSVVENDLTDLIAFFGEEGILSFA